MLKVFIGYDDRQILSFTTLVSSIYQYASRPVAISPLVLETLPIARRGLTPFTFSRFLVPWLCDFQGVAIFMDADMLFVSDVCELETNVSPDIAVSVVRSLDVYEQTSFMLINCAHPSHKVLTPEFIESTDINLHALEWLKETQIGELDPKWNQLVGYQEIDSREGNLHYTMGITAFPETSTADDADIWRDCAKRATSTIPWVEIMGPSVHVITVEGVKFPKYVWDFEKNQPKPEHFKVMKMLIDRSKEVRETAV